MEVSKELLMEALSQCLPGVEAGKSLLEGADTFIFDETGIHSYNDNITVSVPFVPETPITGAVKAKEFYALISKLKGDVVKIVPRDEDNVWVISSGKIQMELALLEASVKERILCLDKDKLDFLPVAADFVEAMTDCKFSCNRSALRGIFVSGAEMASTDELRINFRALSADMGEFWIDDPAANELMRLKDVEGFAVSEGWVHFRVKSGTIFSCKRLLNKNFPFGKLKALVAQHEKTDTDIAHVLPSGLAEAAGRAAVLSMDIDSYESVRLTVSPEGIEVYSQRSTGKYKEMVAWDTPVTEVFDPVVIYIDPGMIEYGLKRTKSFFIRQTESGGRRHVRLVFEGEKYKHLISTFEGQ